MMPTAAPQQTAVDPAELPPGSRLRTLLGELATRQVLARSRSPKMKETSFTRAYAAARGGLAVVGLGALIGFSVLPLQGFQYLQHLAAEPFSIPATTTAGPIQASLVESVTEREQRALAEFIAKRWRIADSAATSFVS